MKMTIRTDPAAAPLVLDFDALTNRDVMALEDLVGATLTDWSDRLSAKSPSMRDLTTLMWLARRQNGEKDLRFDDVEFRFGALDVAVEDGDQEGTVAGDARPTVTPSGPIDVASTPVG